MFFYAGAGSPLSPITANMRKNFVHVLRPIISFLDCETNRESSLTLFDKIYWCPKNSFTSFEIEENEKIDGNDSSRLQTMS